MKLNRFHKIILAALLAAQNFLAAAQTNTAAATNAAPPDYSTFSKFITQRNIFDPYRLPGVISVPHTNRPFVPPPPPPPPPASFSLVGIIGYGEGSMAGTYVFFNGSDPQFHKTARLNSSIASFKVADIAADSVTLMAGTNKLVLGIGEQLQDDGSGHWLFANGTVGRYSTASSYGNGRNSGRGGFNNGGGGRRRNNNFGNAGNGNFNGGNTGGGNFNNGNTGNFGRGRNNFGPSAGAADNSQGSDQNNMTFPLNSTFIPIMIAPDNSAAPDDTTSPDNNQ
jgi:hypothetical protein